MLRSSLDNFSLIGLPLSICLSSFYLLSLLLKAKVIMLFVRSWWAIFDLSLCSFTQVEILGEGTEMRVEVANPKDRLVNFGALRVGESIKRTVPVINNSPAPLSFTVVITPLSSILQQLPNVLSLAPTKEIYLKPKGGTCNLDLVFTPKCRIPQFTEEVKARCFVFTEYKCQKCTISVSMVLV